MYKDELHFPRGGYIVVVGLFLVMYLLFVHILYNVSTFWFYGLNPQLFCVALFFCLQAFLTLARDIKAKMDKKLVRT